MEKSLLGTTVAVIGQGYVGLPLAIAAAEAGFDVVGVERDVARVGHINAGVSHIGDVAEDALRGALKSGRYRAVVDIADAGPREIVVLCVPTPYAKDEPDMSFVRAAGEAVGRHMQPGALVILESTTYPGTTEELLQPILEQASGLTGGRDFDLAFSPERIDPGNATFGLRNTPKIVGGITPRSTERAAQFYGALVDKVVPVSGPKTAEMAKLLENSFRHINIALVNELAVLARDLGVDIWEVIDAAASKPFGFMPFYPGPGVGGHCIPVDPMYLSWRIRQLGGSARFIELAREVNAAMPGYCVTRLRELLGGESLAGRSVLLLGVAYKANVPDLRESPGLRILELLREEGAVVTYHDPFVPTLDVGGAFLASVELDAGSLHEIDAAVVVTAHDCIDFEMIARDAPLIFDTRRTFDAHRPNVHRF